MGAESIMKFVVEKLKELPVLLENFVVERKKEMGAESIMKFSVEKLKELPVLLENFVVERKKEMGVESIMKFSVEKLKELSVLLENFVVERKKDMGAESIMKFVEEKRKKFLVLLENFGGNLVDKKLLILGLGLVVLCYCCSGSCRGRGGPGGRGVKTMKAPGRDYRMARPLFESNPKDYFRGLRADRKHVG